MPSLKHLFDELQKLRVDPDNIRIPGQLYDQIVADAEDEPDDEE